MLTGYQFEKAKAHLLINEEAFTLLKRPDAIVSLYLASGAAFTFMAFTTSPAGTIEGYDSLNPESASFYSLSPEMVVAMELGYLCESGLIEPTDEMIALHGEREEAITLLRRSVATGDLQGAKEHIAALDEIDVKINPTFQENAARHAEETPQDTSPADQGAASKRRGRP